jgi:crotonobetainyl-CoA:carnitine CoA-transferase CaiB-like acyl-CoA transferase
VLPLDGALVVGLEQAVSAPHCTRQLADLGARVIKIESPEGDFARYYDEAVPGTSAHFAWANRGKESVVLDLKAQPGRAAMERLLARADVYVQNLAPGVAGRLGLDAEAARERHPHLVAVDISGYGTGGPREQGRAYDLLVQAEAGSCAVTGTAGHPAKPGVPLADIGTGMVAANAVLAALLARHRTGTGAAISVAMFDVVTDWMSWALHQARDSGTDPVPLGVSSPMVAPYGAYRTADDQVIVIGTTNDREWQRLASAVLRRPDLAADPRYAGNADRVRCRPEIDAVIGEWAARHTFAEASADAQAAALGWARLNTPLDVLGHPQLAQRDRWVRTATPAGDFDSLRPAADAADWQWSAGAVPAVGEHTEAVLAELGLPPG